MIPALDSDYIRSRIFCSLTVLDADLDPAKKQHHNCFDSYPGFGSGIRFSGFGNSGSRSSKKQKPNRSWILNLWAITDQDLDPVKSGIVTPLKS